MNLKDFTHKIQTMKLSHTLIEELDLIECRCYIDHLASKEFLLRLFFKTGRDRSRTEESIDFHIFLEQSLFKSLTVVLPDNASIDQIDQLLKISKIAEEHVKSVFSKNESEIRNLKEVYDLIDEFNNRACHDWSSLKIMILGKDRINLFVPKMHPHQKPQEFTIAVINEHTIEELIYMMKTQIKAIEFYEEVLYREDFFDVRFELSSAYRFNIDVILNDDLARNERVRVRMIDPDFVEVTYSIDRVTSNSEYVEISDKNSQIVYKVSSNDDYEKRDYVVETSTSQRCSLKDFHKTLSDVKFRLKDRIIHIRPVED
jgi:hypothetical protein